MTPSLKIVVISNYYPPNIKGGYEVACFRMCEALRANGHQVTVITGQLSSGATTINHDHFILVPHHYDQQSKQQTANINQQNYTVISQHLKTRNYDIAYIWNLKCIGVELLLPIFEQKMPIVFEYGDFWLDAYLKPYWYRVLQTVRYRKRYDLLVFEPAISVSSWFTQALQSTYGLENITTIENAISLIPAIQPVAIKPLRRFLFCGRIVPEKGIEIAIETLYYLHQYNIEAYLDIVGFIEPSYLSYLSQHIESRGLTLYIHFKEPVSDTNDIYPFYQALLMPTQTQEPFGLVLIEAMQHGLICFASNGYGPKDILIHEESGILIDSSDPKLWCQSILKLSNDVAKIQHMQNTALIELQSRFNLSVKVDKTIAYFHQIMSPEIS